MTGASPVYVPPEPRYVDYTSTRSRPTGSRRTSTTSTSAAGPRQTSSASSATTTPSSGAPATWPGEQYTGNVGTQRYDPEGEIACNPAPPGTAPRRCLALRGSGDGTNDVLQYWFGGYLAVLGDGVDPETGTAFALAGLDEPFDGFDWTINGGDGADNQVNTSSFIATSGILPPEEFMEFESWPAARWNKPGGPFDPHTGERYVYSQIADASYKRLTKEVAVPAAGGR